MAYTDQLLNDVKSIKTYASGVLENISCLPSVIGNILGANILGEFTAIALEGIKENFIAIADNISQQVQRTIFKFTSKLSQVSELATNIAKAVCGVEALINGVARDIKKLAGDMQGFFKQSERCQFIGAQIGACIRAKIYNQLAGQIQKGIINSDLYKDLAYGKISALEKINAKTDKFMRNINVPGIADDFLKTEADRVSRMRRQLTAVNGFTQFGTNAPRYGRNTYADYNFRNRPIFANTTAEAIRAAQGQSTSGLLVESLPSTSTVNQ